MKTPKETILIVGGAGYIGSHTAYLLSQNYHIVIIDTLLHGQAFTHPWATLINADFADQTVLDRILSTYNIRTVMHFAALIEVGLSVKKPREFYTNNVQKTLMLLDALVRHKIKNFIFSSSCAVYGTPQQIPLTETHPTNPINPYGRNKLAIEFALQDYAHAYDFNYVSLRYFNAAGALHEHNLGEQHNPETHIIPLVLQAIHTDTPFTIFGTDYKTNDGTCVRDYVHVLDIAHAHILALDYLNQGGTSDIFNLGSGNGYTVKHVIHAAEDICKKKARVLYSPRRPGDVDVLLADATKARTILGWKPQHSTLQEILTSAYIWHTRNSNVSYKKGREQICSK